MMTAKTLMFVVRDNDSDEAVDAGTGPQPSGSMNAPTDEGNPPQLQDNDTAQETPADPNDRKGFGPTITLNHDFMASIRRRPFRVLAASPLLLMAGASLVALTISTLLCDIIIHSGEGDGSNDNDRHVTHAEHTKQPVLTLEEKTR